MIINHLLSGPVAFDSKSTFGVPQHFVKGCSYTLSAWVWLWPSRFKGSIFNTRTYEGHKLMDDDRLLHPAIFYNLNGKAQFFFACALDGDGLPMGFYSGNSGSSDSDVEFMRWQHVALVISAENNTLSGYIDGKHVQTVGLGGNSELNRERCPYNPFHVHVPVFNNSVLSVFPDAGSVGLVQDAMLFRGEALTTEGVKALVQRRPPAALPTLDWLVAHYRVKEELTEPNAPAAEATTTELTSVPASASDVEVKAFPLAVAARRLTRHVAHSGHNKRSNWGRGFGDGDDVMSRSDSSDGDGGDSYSDEDIDGGGPPALLYTVAESVQETLSELVVQTAAGNLSQYLLGHVRGSDRDSRVPVADGSAPSAVAMTSDASAAVPAGDEEYTPRVSSYYTGRASLNLFHSAYKLPDGSTVNFGDWETHNLHIQQELQDAATLWVSGRHADMRNDSAMSLHAWRERYYEQSFSALVLKVFVTNDYYTLHASEVRNDMGWPKPFAGQRAHGALMQLGYRMGYDMNSGGSMLHMVNETQLYEMIGQLSEQHVRLLAGAGGAQDAKSKRTVSENEAAITIRDRGDPVIEGMLVVRETLLDPAMELNLKSGTEAVMEDGRGLGLDVCVDVSAASASAAVASASAAALTDNYALNNNSGLIASLDKLSTPVKLVGNTRNSTAEDNDLVAAERRSGTGTAAALWRRETTGIYSASSQNQCASALVYYNPVAQFVVSHWDRPWAGNRPLERVRISDGPRSLVGQTGRDDNLFVLREMEAAGGNHYADVWLARAYWFGYHGVQRNMDAALRHFTRAANAGNAEALYNLGVFSDHGYAGMPVNKSLAFEYFNQSAHHPQEPFSMALEVLGNHYLGYNGLLHQNSDKAKQYFERAATLGSAEAHYSLARLYIGPAGAEHFTDADIDAPQAMVHLARAVGGGNRRAMEAIAGAIFDPNSWLHRYERERQAQDLMRQYLAETHDIREVQGPIPPRWHDAKMLHEALHARDEESKRKRAGRTKHNPTAQWKYIPGQVIYIPVTKPEINVALSFPLESSEEHTGMPLCKVALTLMKMVAEHSSRSNELMREALAAFVEGDHYRALERYDEAAELGVLEAHENSIYLTNIIMQRECGVDSNDEVSLEQLEGHFVGPITRLTAFLNAGEKVQGGYFEGDPTSRVDGSCRRYFQRSLGRRYSHLAHIANDPVAIRVIAGELAHARFPFDDHGYEHVHIGEREDDNEKVRTAVNPTVYLHAYNAIQGDVYSLMYLGWAFWTGSVEGIARNLTSAKRIFESACKIELKGQLYRGGYSFSQEFVPTTMGVAPKLAESLVDLEIWWDGVQFQALNVMDVGHMNAFAAVIRRWSLTANGVKLETTNTLLTALCCIFALLVWARARRHRQPVVDQR